MNHNCNHGEFGCKYSHKNGAYPFGGGIEFDFFVTRDGREYQFICRVPKVMYKLDRIRTGDKMSVFYELKQDNEGESYMLTKYVLADGEKQLILEI